MVCNLAFVIGGICVYIRSYTSSIENILNRFLLFILVTVPSPISSHITVTTTARAKICRCDMSLGSHVIECGVYLRTEKGPNIISG
jgi:hypothetical protein